MSVTFIQRSHLPFTSLSMFSSQVKSAGPTLSVSYMWLLTGHPHVIYPWLFPKLSREDFPLPWTLLMSPHVKPYFLLANLAQTVRETISKFTDLHILFWDCQLVVNAIDQSMQKPDLAVSGNGDLQPGTNAVVSVSVFSSSSWAKCLKA